MPSAAAPGVLARGPWDITRVRATWHEDRYEPPAAATAAADAAIAALAERGSPSHDGVGARFLGYTETGSPAARGLHVDLQPLRWALRLVEGDASASLSALCVTRDAEGRWLAGRRAPWLASWAGRWALGAGGAVDPYETPAETLTRELREEWSVAAERVRGELLVRLPHNLIMFIGQAWLAPGTEVVPDHEHDAHAWWPADIDAWPPEATDELRGLARLLVGGQDG